MTKYCSSSEYHVYEEVALCIAPLCEGVHPLLRRSLPRLDLCFQLECLFFSSHLPQETRIIFKYDDCGGMVGRQRLLIDVQGLLVVLFRFGRLGPATSG